MTSRLIVIFLLELALGQVLANNCCGCSRSCDGGCNIMPLRTFPKSCWGPRLTLGMRIPPPHVFKLMNTPKVIPKKTLPDLPPPTLGLPPLNLPPLPLALPYNCRRPRYPCCLRNRGIIKIPENILQTGTHRLL